MQGNNVLLGVVALLLAVGGGWILYSTNKTPTEAGPIVLGVSIPLTGEVAAYGESVRGGIDLAVKEINETGGVNGRMLSVIYEDDKCDTTGASAITKLVTIDKITALVGPICSGAASAGLPVSEQNKVPAIIWASAPGLVDNRPYAFRTYPADSFQGKYAAEYIVNELKIKRAAVLYANNDWGNGLAKVFAQRFKELGGEIVATESAAQEETDVRTQMVKIKTANPGIIYMPLHPGTGIAAAKQARTLGMTKPMFGGDIFDTKEFASALETEGIMYTIGKFSQPEDFKAKLKAASGKDSTPFTPLAYDTIYIYASIFKKVGTNADAVRGELEKLNFTAGIALPRYTFDAEGDLDSADLEVRVVKNGTGVPLSQ